MAMLKHTSDFQRKIIFIGGIHGVGKTTLCNSICSEFNIEHYSAGELISRFNKINFSKNKLVNNIKKNQDILVASINKYLNTEKNYIIDGHFCLLDKNGNIINIPLSTYKEIDIIAIIVLFDNPANIYTRLESRDETKYDISFLSSFQKDEISYSESVANYLNIPYLKANPFSDNEIILKFITDIL